MQKEINSLDTDSLKKICSCYFEAFHPIKYNDDKQYPGDVNRQLQYYDVCTWIYYTYCIIYSNSRSIGCTYSKISIEFG